jgi:branched-chain amino acid aminotransferase
MAQADIWLDGSMVPWRSAQARVDSPVSLAPVFLAPVFLGHAAQRGALVFDVGALRPGRSGPLLFRPRDHIARFLRSAALIGLRIGWDEEALLRATIETARRSRLELGLVRWSAFVPSLEPDVVPRTGAPTSVAIAAIAPEDSALPGQAPAIKAEAVRVMVPEDIRKAGPEVFPPQAKVAASYLGPMLAKQRALAAGFDEVVLLDSEARVAEAPTANVFLVRDGALVTPPLDRVLAGITRHSVLEIARAEGLDAREEHFTASELRRADEAFLVATSLPVQAVASVDRSLLRAGAPGPVTKRIKEAVAACERGEDPRFAEWVAALT